MKTSDKLIKFHDWNCKILLKRYLDRNRIAIELRQADTNEPITMATVNIIHETIADDEVCIKDYSENEGMLKILTDAEIISAPVRFVSTGYVTKVPVCKLLISLPE